MDFSKSVGFESLEDMKEVIAILPLDEYNFELWSQISQKGQLTLINYVKLHITYFMESNYLCKLKETIALKSAIISNNTAHNKIDAMP